MNQKSHTRLLAVTLVNLLSCLMILVWLFAPERKVSAQGPPPTFLGPIYYGSNPVTAVFDHDLPYLSIPGDPDDGNVCTRHNTGTPCNPNPPNGFGYDEHDGIDYGLDYEPVLAAADGVVDAAGWADPTDHRDGLGLRVKIEHANGYITEYGHLSVLQVQTDDQIEVDPDNRHGIIGISGNTGNVIGNNCDPDDDPTCGAHLHFGLIEPGGARVNPYGWVGPAGEDPWEQDLLGAASHNVWVDEPSITTAQFPNGDAINDPGVNNARMIIDDGSADFFPGRCWTFAGGSASYNNGYHRAPSDGEDNCTARWNVRGDAFTVPGDYDLFVHIPAYSNPSLSAAYDVHHNNKVSRAIAVQVAYVNNNEHDAWAYLGRYDFAMSDSVGEFVLLYDDDMFGEDDGRYTLADAIMLAPANGAMPLPQRYLYVSFASSGYAGNVPYEDEDILLFDAATGEWRMFFDGSDVGLAGVDIDAVDFRDGYLHFSLDAPLGSFTDADIIRFNPTSLGEDTSGTMSAFMPGEKLGLTPAEFPGEDVDALAFNHQGKILLSTQGQSEIGPDIFEDEDLFISDSDTSASLFFDGSEYALNAATENVNGIWLGSAGHIYLTTTGLFAVPGTSGDGADIFICAPGIFQNCWFEPGLFWNGSAHGIPNMSIDDFYLGGYIPLPGECGNLPLNCSFEDQFAHWTVVAPNPQNENWLPTISETHSGWYSAMGEITSGVPDTTLLNSSPITLQPIGIEYRFSFYGKAFNTSSESVVIGVVVYWGDNNGNLDGGGKLIGVVSGIHTEWTLFTTPFVCMPWWGNSAEFSFHVAGEHFVQGEGYLPENVERFFIDDVRVESRPNANCPTLNSGGN